MKKVVILAVALLLSACSTMAPKTEDSSIKSEFLGGSIKVVYKKTGEIESIESINSTRLTSSLPSAVDEAYSLASLRARKQIVEFIKVEVETDRFATIVYDSLQSSELENKALEQSVNSKIAQQIQQNIRQKSSAILKGTYVSSKVYDESTKTVTVTVKSGEQDVEAAKRISRLMGN